ncbi:peptidoglycan-recognition protein LC-like isoform X2 [Choristoneura fumiferana]|uniref:peptidoglycan-recognition protein LC-like isoform X2 n=1 Tax=Choristoneura fumiferana TaxID=7141 RepID=UPI003D15CFB8
MAINKDSVNFCDKNKNLDISVVGEFGDLEIVEETCDSDDAGSAGANTISTFAKPAASPPVFGTVSVSNSENVHFGNNTYFQGPVTIKQIIQSKSGIENASYNKTDDEISKPPLYKEGTFDTGSDGFSIKTWQKITISAILFVVASTCGIIFGLQKMPDGNEDDAASERVTGSSHEYSSKMTMVVIVVTPFITAWASYCILTMNFKFSFLFINQTANCIVTVKEPPKKLGEQGELLIAPDHLRIVSRMEWLAQPETGPLDKLRLPAPWVIISHTATAFCYSQSSCVYNVRLVQSFHVESRGWYDIGYNYLVGGEGSAYYGRGWDYMGAHTLGYNKYSIGIAFIGTFTKEAPTQKQLDACKKLIKRGVALGKIAKDYKLFAHRQLTSTESPGEKLFEILQEWPHFVKDVNLTNILPNY